MWPITRAMNVVAVAAAGSEMQIGVVALMAFGMIVLGLFSRVFDGGRRKRSVRELSAEPPTLHAHGPRHTGSRRPKAGNGLSDADRLVQLERLAAKGHITAEDFARAKAELHVGDDR